MFLSSYLSTKSKFEKGLDSILAKFQQSTFTITPSDVRCALRTIKIKTSTGVDLIFAKQFENASDLIVQHLLLLFQMSISSGMVPQQFCISQTTPIPKKGKKNLENYQSYCPITVLCTLLKIFSLLFLVKFLVSVMFLHISLVSRKNVRSMLFTPFLMF